jgi:pimeloyl-ACP methyl ester carboxylesterase
LLSLNPTEVRQMPHGATLEFLVAGEGEPTTAFAHGLAGAIPDTRPMGSGVAGRKVFFQFRGHGRSDTSPKPLTYADLAADLRAVADEFAASRALGVSLGAGALARLLTQSPDRFERVVFVMPAVLDRQRPAAQMARIRSLLEAVSDEDAATAATLLASEIPMALRDRPASWRYIRERLDSLFREGLVEALVDLPDAVALTDITQLKQIEVPALVIGCRGDVAHPATIAEELAEALPNAALHIYDQPAIVWTNRADLRTRISEFLNQ